MAVYGTNITMSQDTVAKLTDGGFWLYGFKAVKAPAKGSPLVWLAMKIYTLTTALQWEDTCAAFTSRAELKPNATITAAATYPMGLQQTLELTSAGTGMVDASRGVADAISIVNTTGMPFTCGLALPGLNGASSLICGFNLFGYDTVVVAPTKTILLMVARQSIDAGTVIETALGPGILVDLTGAPAELGIPTREVSYDFKQGWSWDKGSWGTIVAPNADLVPLLIQN